MNGIRFATAAGHSGVNVICVTVTYGNRKELLCTVIDVLPAQGVDKVVVVDNGANWLVRLQLTEAYGDFVDVVEMGRNTGSAQGFASGILRAKQIGAEFIWLLDDDNFPVRFTLATLLSEHERALTRYRQNILAVSGYRSGLYLHLVKETCRRDNIKARNYFLGFHLQSALKKRLVKILSDRRQRRTSEVASHISHIELTSAAYGGLLFHERLIDYIGLPRADFILYEDDTEWTGRIIKCGGTIVLITNAIIEDLAKSWVTDIGEGSGFYAWIRGKEEFKVYYSIRNKVYISKENGSIKSPVFLLNAIIYIILIALVCVFLCEFKRLKLIMDSILDGFFGRLGAKPYIDM